MNLISVPLNDDTITTSGELLAAICSGEADSIWTYECSSAAYFSWTILDSGPGWGVWTGLPVWVNITNLGGCIWTPGGYLDTTITYSLCPGMNLVSLPLYSSSINRASGLLADIPNCTAVFRWKRSVSCLTTYGFDGFYERSEPVEDFSVHHGYSYWVNVTSAITWIPPYP